MNSPTPKECYDCQISARIRKQMLNVTNIDSMAKLQACLRQLCNKCRVWDKEIEPFAEYCRRNEKEVNIYEGYLHGLRMGRN